MEDHAVERYAKRICKQEGLTFLSCEFYANHSRPLWIAVEDDMGERFEIKRPMSRK